MSLVLIAAGSVLFVLLDQRNERIAAAAGLFAGAALVLIPLAIQGRRREQEQRVEIDRAEARYRALLDGLPLVTWLTDSGDRSSSLYVSPSIGDLTGYSPAEWMEEPGLFAKLLHPEDRARVLAELEGAVNGTPVRMDYRLLARDGRAVWVRDETVTVRDPAGEALYTQTFLRDLGELRRSEDQRERLQVAERAAAEEVAERQSRLDLVRRAGQELSSTLDPREKFYRADPQMVRGVGGTGLGLYICKELVSRMGGTIWVEPNSDTGSAFFFELQTADVLAHGNPEPGRDEAPSTTRTILRSPRTSRSGSASCSTAAGSTTRSRSGQTRRGCSSTWATGSCCSTVMASSGSGTRPPRRSRESMRRASSADPPPKRFRAGRTRLTRCRCSGRPIPATRRSRSRSTPVGASAGSRSRASASSAARSTPSAI
ncbi:MAG: PAS domain S-box protein [Actinobacteria bacterium]|nr:MAG: PAS domain S-box protein [Actinomycetota bacterium]